MDEAKGFEGVARSLREGWHYQPHWRHVFVERILVASAAVEDPLEVLSNEQDAYVRQYYLLRRTGGCMSRESILWAYRAHTNNRKTGVGSLIKAMVVAGFSNAEIAVRSRTTAKNVIVFLKLFFDVEHCTDAREWLASIIFATADGPQDLAAFREARWMTAAFLHGREGLERSLSRRVVMDPAEREKMTAEIRATLTARAHQFIASMECSYTPPTGADFDRLVKLLDATARQPLPDDSDNKMQNFIRSFHGLMVEKAQQPEFASDERLQALRQNNSQKPVTAGDAGK